MKMIKRIVHVADIHIFRRNHQRIQYAWNEMMDSITEPQSTAIVIAGDIFEDKIKLYGADIDMFKSMLDIIENKNIRTVIIPGNHDFNDSTHDLLTSLMKGTQYKYINYWKDTGRYDMENVSFYVYSPIDGKIPDIETIDESDRINVAIAHEPINGCKFDSSIIFNGGRFDASQFKDFHITCLGDIHVPQFLTPTVAYCGSLVQKNRGEGLTHGYIEWDLKTLCGEFKQLTAYQNDIVIKLQNNVMTDLPDGVDPKA